jgi:hypothetical protein
MRGNALGALVADLMAVAGAILGVYLWVTAIAYDYKRNEPLLTMVWVACPPCGVIRGGYLLI